MAEEKKRNAYLKPLLLAIGCDVLTFACFAAYYSLADGKTLWLAAGLLFVFASFPFYRQTAILFRNRGK